MNILIVGGGALGQFYGSRLAEGGSSVSYLVRPPHAERARGGFVLHRLRRLGGPVTRRFVPHEVFSDPAGTAGRVWDEVWLCVPSTALDGPWTAELRDQVGMATIVTIGQDSRDLPTLERTWPPQQIVQVEPTAFAYEAPLEGEVSMESGTAYWVPPGSMSAISGTPERARAVERALRRGGIRARRIAGAGTGDRTAAVNVPYVAAIEIAGWSLEAARAELAPAAAAAREASTVVAALHGRTDRSRIATSPWLAGVVFWLLPRIAPFDVAAYVRFHFTKVGAQTRQMLDGWIAEGERRDLPVARLRDLRAALPSLVDASR